MTVGAERQPGLAADAAAFIRTSVVLQRLQDDAPEEHFTLDWLMTSLGKRSYGMVLLLLAALVALAVALVAVSNPARAALKSIGVGPATS